MLKDYKSDYERELDANFTNDVKSLSRQLWRKFTDSPVGNVLGYWDSKAVFRKIEKLQTEDPRGHYGYCTEVMEKAKRNDNLLMTTIILTILCSIIPQVVTLMLGLGTVLGCVILFALGLWATMSRSTIASVSGAIFIIWESVVCSGAIPWWASPFAFRLAVPAGFLGAAIFTTAFWVMFVCFLNGAKYDYLITRFVDLKGFPVFNERFDDNTGREYVPENNFEGYELKMAQIYEKRNKVIKKTVIEEIELPQVEINEDFKIVENQFYRSEETIKKAKSTKYINGEYVAPKYEIEELDLNSPIIDTFNASK
jgi:hypothetical protein